MFVVVIATNSDFIVYDIIWSVLFVVIQFY